MTSALAASGVLVWKIEGMIGLTKHQNKLHGKTKTAKCPSKCPPHFGRYQPIKRRNVISLRQFLNAAEFGETPWMPKPPPRGSN
jgi:hypothetical protein